MRTKVTTGSIKLSAEAFVAAALILAVLATWVRVATALAEAGALS